MTSNSREFIESVLMNRLEKAHWDSPDKLHFRCPLCGDSKKDPNKTRGGILLDGDKVGFNCFNCQPGLSFVEFLQKFDYGLYRQYRLGRLRDDLESNQIDLNIKPQKKKKVDYPNIDRFELTSVRNLSNSHPAVMYLRDRKIPKHRWSSIFYTDDFSKIASTYSDTKTRIQKPTIVFPFRKRDGSIYGFQARYLEGKFRYQTAIIDKSLPKMINLDKVDLTKKVHVFEGFFDSCFVPNSIAVLDSSLFQRVLDCDELNEDNTVLWYDNEPFNKQIMKMKKDAIERGFTTVFYPREFMMFGKDLNDFVINTTKPQRERIMSQIQFESGFKARLLHIENLKGK